MIIHHIGYLVKNMEKAVCDFTALGYRLETDICFDEPREIDLCFMRNSEYLIELVMPKSENSVAWNLLKKNGTGPYHICYQVDHLPSAIDEWKKKGFFEIAEPQEAVALSGRKVAFLTGRNIGMIELLEG